MVTLSKISTRISNLEAALSRRQLEQAEPEDGLSQSMREWRRELSALDEQGKLMLLAELNTDGLGLNMSDLERMIDEVAR